MKNILILDTETTGLDPAKDSVIEVAAVLYSVEHATVLETFSTLVTAFSNPAEHINRIPDAALANAAHPAAAWARVRELATRAEAYVAHRAEFDHSFTPEAVASVLPWICSKFDIEWPKQKQPGSSLVQLVLEHDLGVAYAHRAAADCDMLARLFTRSRELGADLNAMLERAMRPKADFVALVSYDDREKAKQAGFRWEPDRKRWKRRMFIEDAGALPFKVQEAS